MKKDILLVKDVVEDILRTDDKARNNDKWLVLNVLRRMGYRVFIPYGDLDRMPSFESITRCRRKFQAEGKYKAAQEIVMRRDMEEKEMTGINKWM